jgi:histone H3/H4
MRGLGVSGDVKIQAGAISCLQEAAEAYLVGIFESEFLYPEIDQGKFSLTLK